jgi:hypothetical protein
MSHMNIQRTDMYSLSFIIQVDVTFLDVFAQLELLCLFFPKVIPLLRYEARHLLPTSLNMVRTSAHSRARWRQAMCIDNKNSSCLHPNAGPACRHALDVNLHLIDGFTGTCRMEAAPSSTVDQVQPKEQMLHEIQQ